MADISNTDNIIDSRDVIKRIEELEGDDFDCGECGEFAFTAEGGVTHHYGDGPTLIDHDADENHVPFRSAEEVEELATLKALAEQGENFSDWQHGATLIHDSHFEDYARETAEEMHGEALASASWPFDSIDWESAANDLQTDYTSVDFDGETYWTR